MVAGGRRAGPRRDRARRMPTAVARSRIRLSNGDGALDLVRAGRLGPRACSATTAAVSTDDTTARLASVREARRRDRRRLRQRRPSRSVRDLPPATRAVPAEGGRRVRRRDATAAARAAAIRRRRPPPRSPISITTAISTSSSAAADASTHGDAAILRNNGNGTFADITAAAGLRAPPAAASRSAPTDYDNRRDIDVLIAARDGRRRSSATCATARFANAAADAGWRRPPATTARRRGRRQQGRQYPDFFFGAANGPAVARAERRPRALPRRRRRPTASRGASAAQFVDYDNDGLLDLLTMARDGVRLARQTRRRRWTDVTDAAGLASLRRAATPQRSSRWLPAISTATATPTSPCSTGRRRAALPEERRRQPPAVAARPAGGPRQQSRSASARRSSCGPAACGSVLETSRPRRPPAPAGRRVRPRLARRAPMSSACCGRPAFCRPRPCRPRAPHAQFAVTELDRKPSSCPYLFTWNGTRFEFVTDFMGGGEMGSWAGPGVMEPARSRRIRPHPRRSARGRATAGYELRVTNELEEALFVDRLQLVAVDHPAERRRLSERGHDGAPSPFALQRVRPRRARARATTSTATTCWRRSPRLDRRYPETFALPIRGYAGPHTLDARSRDAAGPGERTCCC